MPQVLAQVDSDEVLDNLNMDDIYNYLKKRSLGEILDLIGKDKCITHFDIEEKEAE